MVNRTRPLVGSVGESVADGEVRAGVQLHVVQDRVHPHAVRRRDAARRRSDEVSGALHGATGCREACRRGADLGTELARLGDRLTVSRDVTALRGLRGSERGSPLLRERLEPLIDVAQVVRRREVLSHQAVEIDLGAILRRHDGADLRIGAVRAVERPRRGRGEGAGGGIVGRRVAALVGPHGVVDDHLVQAVIAPAQRRGLAAGRGLLGLQGGVRRRDIVRRGTLGVHGVPCLDECGDLLVDGEEVLAGPGARPGGLLVDGVAGSGIARDHRRDGRPGFRTRFAVRR